MTPEEFVDAYGHLVTRAAAREHKGSALFTVEDLEQEAWAAMLPYLDRLAAEGEGFIYRSAVAACARHAARERTAYSWFSGAYLYTPELVKGELEVGAWLTDAGEDWALRIDIRTAYDALPLRDQKALFRRYVNGEKAATSTGRMTILRAIERMTHWLNGNAALEVVDLDTAWEVA